MERKGVIQLYANGDNQGYLTHVSKANQKIESSYNLQQAKTYSREVLANQDIQKVIEISKGTIEPRLDTIWK